MLTRVSFCLKFIGIYPSTLGLDALLLSEYMHDMIYSLVSFYITEGSHFKLLLSLLLNIAPRLHMEQFLLSHPFRGTFMVPFRYLYLTFLFQPVLYFVVCHGSVASTSYAHTTDSLYSCVDLDWIACSFFKLSFKEASSLGKNW
ncbi:hypothetical protein MPTK1_Vg00450 [Marchantia polymorpha subsp. ruderalis]|uniref:Uncharacterized protein n=1 Tax=Marchantia polymorpha TaxID=3197 RepID=A0A2R6VWN2_MARPO|nr:hypothetical protein MARPO_YB0008 [Marchantia polymorpha]BBN20531.1 hypothetical protein Mp_Vg00450 [Marchantia polymorpha subsp. ruderalis]|eukprot:PTQ26027.1 hypothetical protein MARPO_YB0008 [Marchantia polymorpha]